MSTMVGRERVVSRAHLVPLQWHEARVHSVFERACNLAVGTRLLTVHDAGMAHTPTSVRVVAIGAPAWGPRVRPGALALLEGRILRLGPHLLDLTRARVWHPAPIRAGVDRTGADERLHQVAGLRDAHVRQHADLDPDPLTESLRALAEGLRASSPGPSAIPEAVRRLVGAGPGLTPSGDDALVGLLAALNRSGDAGLHPLTEKLSAAVLDQAHRTTDISAHHLGLAVDGAFSEPLVDLADAVLHGVPGPELTRLTHEALSLGATSGADGLLGLLTGLRLVLEPDLHTTTDEKVA